jgi:hypothetical protein
LIYTVVIPEPIRNEIASWGLPIEAETELYKRLQADLEIGHEVTCYRVAAPSPTYVYSLELDDPSFPILKHHFTFWLTYGPKDDCLYVHQCSHKEEEVI